MAKKQQRIKKATDPARLKKTSGIITHRIEAHIAFIKGMFVSISSDTHKVVQEAADLCDLGLFEDATRLADTVPEKSYCGLNKRVEQRIVRNAILSYVADAKDRFEQFGVLGFVKPICWAL